MSQPTSFPLFVEAKSKRDLVKAMFNNNMKFSSHFKYFDIQKDGKTWVAWYYIDSVTHRNLIREFLDGQAK